MKKMRILVLSDIAPCTNITSGIVLNQWCDYLLDEGHELYYVLVADPGIKMDIPDDKYNRIKFTKFNKPREGWSYNSDKIFLKIKGKIRSFIKNNSVKHRELPVILNSILKLIKDENIDIVLSSIQGQTMTWLTYKLIKKSNVKVVSQTWDPLNWWLDAFQFDYITKMKNLKMFGKICKLSDTFMGMSWQMSINYEKKYGANCVTNIPSLDPEPFHNFKMPSKKSIDIALSGQIYAKDEFETLVKSCELLNWKYNQKDIFIHLYGNYFDEKFKNNSHIIINSHIPQEQLFKELKKMDLLYCPYWFSKKYIEPCKLSFPGKLTTYLKVGVPILMHGPSYASPLIFVKEYKAAYMVESLDVEIFKNNLCDILNTYDKNSSIIVKNANSIFNKYLTKDTMRKSLLCSLGLIPKSENKLLESVRSIYEKRN